jgi:hypothetical protein
MFLSLFFEVKLDKFNKHPKNYFRLRSLVGRSGKPKLFLSNLSIPLFIASDILINIIADFELPFAKEISYFFFGASQLFQKLKNRLKPLLQ